MLSTVFFLRIKFRFRLTVQLLNTDFDMAATSNPCSTVLAPTAVAQVSISPRGAKAFFSSVITVM